MRHVPSGRLTVESPDGPGYQTAGASDSLQRARLASECRVSLEELQGLLIHAAAILAPPELRAQLQARLELVQAWQKRASLAFVKQGCALSLAEALEGNGHYELVGLESR